MLRLRVIPLFFVLFLLMSCAPKEPVFRTESGLLGTVISVSVYDRVADETLDDVFARVRDIHDRMAVTVPGSEVNRLRDSAPKAADLSDDTISLLTLARECSELSGGAFDVTAGPLVSLWGIGTPQARVPDDEEIRAMRRLVGWRVLEIRESEGQARLAAAGMSVDLGAIAKGYACDESVRILRQAGVKSALLDFGGNIYTLGTKPGDTPWRVGIKNPLPGEKAGSSVAVLEVSDTAVVTSGAYERYFEQNGLIWHHILNPFTGKPAMSGLLSATIVCKNAALADALSTACFVMGAEEGLAMIEELEGVEAVLIGEDRMVHATRGLSEHLILSDDRFTLAAS